ncbi:hypothetical protein [Candidatus Phytoplasma asteris]|uniref:hypothetical protein n=1 Tax=Candidatus Phytoplasma asteris TaxID=85620 RepID=UPI0039E0DB46
MFGAFDLKYIKNNEGKQIYTIIYLRQKGDYEDKELVKEGFNVEDFKEIGYQLPQLIEIFSLKKLNKSGYSLEEIKNLDPQTESFFYLKQFSARDLKDKVGFTLQEMQLYNYNLKDFAKGGISIQEIKETPIYINPPKLK